MGFLPLSLSAPFKPVMLNASIDSLPLDAVVQILCKLNHDELKPVIVVSKFFHDAVQLARQLHFDFSTPPPKTWLLCGENDRSPEAPVRHHCKKQQKLRLSEEESQRIAVVLFPAGDCKRRLVHRQHAREEMISPHHYQRAIHASYTNA